MYDNYKILKYVFNKIKTVVFFSFLMRVDRKLQAKASNFGGETKTTEIKKQKKGNY